MKVKPFWVIIICLLVAGLFAGLEENPRRTSFDEYYLPIIEQANFTPGITNPYLPLVIGNKWTYKETGEEPSEKIQVEVLNETKMVLGIACTVVRDRVYEDGNLVEDTSDWFAQDLNGNVWYMGEDSKVIVDGEIVSTHGSWEAGIDGAQPGIIMWASPFPGIPYRQEYLYGEAEDWGQVIAILDSYTIGEKTFTSVVKTKEWSALETGSSEFKYYAPGIGLIREESGKNPKYCINLIETNTGK